MTTHNMDAVLAGSRGFALALLAPLTERIGTRPRVAAGPAQALAHLDGRGGLMVVEFLGPDTLSSLEELVRKGEGLHIVVALPDGHAASEGPLRALGVDLARWNGTPAEVLAAVGRLVGPGSAPSSGRSPAGEPTPPPRAPAWPSDVPGALEAADALLRALAGAAPALGKPLPGLDEVVAGLSEIERAVMTGAPQPPDAEPIRRAAVMRVRVAVALATAPPAGSPVDADAVSALLAEIDAHLSGVSALAAGAPPELLPSLGVVRNALVREAVAFSEAAQRAATVGEARPAPAAAPVRPSRARLLPTPPAPDERVGRPRRALLAVAVVAALAAGAYHAHAFWVRSQLAEEQGRAGAPSNAVVVAGPNAGDSAVLRSADGKPFGDAELKRFVELEALKGNAVVETGPGTLMIVPARRDREPAPAPTSR